MKSKFDSKIRSLFWWFPLARRTLGWGLSGAACWFVPAFALLVAPTFGFLFWWERAEPEASAERYAGMAEILLIYAAVSLALVLAILGAIAGAVCGFCAPPTEPKNPLRSRFFRRVQRETFWTWLAALVALEITVSGVFRFIAPIGLGAFAAFLLSLVGYGLALWRATNRVSMLNPKS